MLYYSHSNVSSFMRQLSRWVSIKKFWIPTLNNSQRKQYIISIISMQGNHKCFHQSLSIFKNCPRWLKMFDCCKQSLKRLLLPPIHPPIKDDFKNFLSIFSIFFSFGNVQLFLFCYLRNLSSLNLLYLSFSFIFFCLFFFIF